MASGWNLWVWLVGVVVRKYIIDILIIIITFPYSTCVSSFLAAASLFLCSFLNVFCSLVLTIKTFVYSKSWTSYSQLFTCFPICLLVDCLLSTCLPAQRQGPYSQGSPLPTDRCAPPVYWYTYLSQCLYSCLFSCSTDNPGYLFS